MLHFFSPPDLFLFAALAALQAFLLQSNDRFLSKMRRRYRLLLFYFECTVQSDFFDRNRIFMEELSWINRQSYLEPICR